MEARSEVPDCLPVAPKWRSEPLAKLIEVVGKRLEVAGCSPVVPRTFSKGPAPLPEVPELPPEVLSRHSKTGASPAPLLNRRSKASGSSPKASESLPEPLRDFPEASGPLPEAPELHPEVLDRQLGALGRPPEAVESRAGPSDSFLESGAALAPAMFFEFAKEFEGFVPRVFSPPPCADRPQGGPRGFPSDRRLSIRARPATVRSARVPRRSSP